MGPVTPPESKATAQKSGTRSPPARTRCVKTDQQIRQLDGKQKYAAGAIPEKPHAQRHGPDDPSGIGRPSCPASRPAGSGSATVMMTPIKKLMATMTHTFLDRVISLPTASPSGIMDISEPR